MKNLLIWLQSEMTRPEPYGGFHLFWIFATIITIVFLHNKNKSSDTKQRVVLFVYGFVALLLEIIKQVIWTIEYVPTTNSFAVDYQWYAAPFQFCSTPMYVSLICAFLKNGRLRNALLSYLSFVTIIGGFMTMILPDSCFTHTIEVNIHTMWLHCGSFVISMYLLTNKIVIATKKNVIDALLVFVSFVGTAFLLNLTIYHSGLLNGETFNMFYISPYFISELPVFNIIQENTVYPIFLLSYIFAISVGAFAIFGLTKFFKLITTLGRTNAR